MQSSAFGQQTPVFLHSRRSPLGVCCKKCLEKDTASASELTVRIQDSAYGLDNIRLYTSLSWCLTNQRQPNYLQMAQERFKQG